MGIFELIYFDIFWLFFRVSLFSFGGVVGVLPEIQRMVVEEHHWMSSHEFIQSYIVGQFVPGPNMSMCPLIGFKVAGVGGAIAAFLGIYGGALLLVGGISTLYFQFRKLAWVRRMECALRPLVFALISASAFVFLRQQLGGRWLSGLAVALPFIVLNYRARLGALSAIFLTGACWSVFVMYGPGL